MLAFGSAACAHANANAVTELPPLEMPAAPPRVVEASEPLEAPPLASPPPLTPVPEPTRQRPTPAQRGDAPRAAEPTRPEPPVEAARPADEAPKAPATTLQTTPTQREGEMERRIRTLIAQAFNDLNRINYQALNANARNQYDTAKRFAIQAEESLQARNLVFASNLADKAAALAAQLASR